MSSDEKSEQTSPSDAFLAAGGAPKGAILYSDRNKGPVLLFGGEAAWSPADPARKSSMIKECHPIDGAYQLSEETTQVYERTLPFYDDVTLIALIDRRWRKDRLIVYFLDHAGELYRLNGTSPPIHEINAKAPIKLSDEVLLDYHRFFCFFVRGEEGPFFVAETMDSPLMPQQMDGKTRDLLESTVRPSTAQGMDDDGRYRCEAVIFYSNALFSASFAVQPGGMIEMLDDDPIAADLPIRIDAPLT